MTGDSSPSGALAESGLVAPRGPRVSLVTQGLGRAFGRRHALRDVTFTAGGGDVVALVGHNGAGKSTLLQVLSTRIAPTQGRALLDDELLSPGCPARVRLGYVSHQSFLYGALTARENLALSARLGGFPEDAVVPTLERVGLGRAKDRLARELSRGMTQRLMIARLLLQDARVWLLDEPSTGLDAVGLTWLQGEVESAAAMGRVVIFSSHDRGLLERSATQGLRLDGGRLTDFGPFRARATDEWLRSSA